MRRVFAIVAIIGALGHCAYAKSGADHIVDMCAVFGTTSDNPHLMPIFQTITSEVDNGRTGHQKYTMCQRMKSVEPNFTWELYTHRIFFHWGFNGDPRKSKALKKEIDDCTTDEHIREKMWGIVLAEQDRRNKRMLFATRRYTTYTGSDGKQKGFAKPEVVNGIAALAYDTHIIGDYIEGQDVPRQALGALEQIQKDVIKAVCQIALNDPDFTGMTELNHFKFQMKKVTNGIDKIRAEKIRHTMKEHIPRILMKSGTFKRVIELEKYSTGVQQWRDAA